MVSTFLDLSHGVPHADTTRRVFERVNPEALQRCFLGWVGQVVKQAGAGYPDRRQCMKGLHDHQKKQSALHVVSACEHRLLLARLRWRPTRLRPSLLLECSITGCVITIDAMGTQTD